MVSFLEMVTHLHALLLEVCIKATLLENLYPSAN